MVIKELPEVPLGTAAEIIDGIAGVVPGGRRMLGMAQRLGGVPARSATSTISGTAGLAADLVYPRIDPVSAPDRNDGRPTQ